MWAVDHRNGAAPLPRSTRRCRALLGAILEPLGRKEGAKAATDLVREFGSLGAVIAAPRYRIEGVAGPAAFPPILRQRQIMAHALRREVARQPVISNLQHLRDYLHQAMAHRLTEQIRVLFLDTKLRLLAEEVMAEGGFGSCEMPFRAIIIRALEQSASGLIIVHNHPGGSSKPSDEDRWVTTRLSNVLTTLSVRLHDHLIVTRTETTSFKELGLL